jgi:hypothetical protein
LNDFQLLYKRYFGPCLLDVKTHKKCDKSFGNIKKADYFCSRKLRFWFIERIEAAAPDSFGVDFGPVFEIEASLKILGNKKKGQKVLAE